MGKRRKSEDQYKMMARTLRAGFIDPERTDEFPVRFRKGTSKAQAIRDLRRAGFAVGHEIEFDPKRGVAVDVRRTGKIARGFTAKEGYDLSEIDEWTPQQKAKLTRVYNKVRELTERPYYVYRGRKKENIEKVQEATSPIDYPDEVQIAFVPVARPGETPKIKIRKREVVIEDEPTTVETVTVTEREVTRTPVYWEDVGVTPKMLREHPRQAVEKMHAVIGAKEYSPMAGAFQQPESYTPGALIREIRDLMYGYPERWPKFLLGVQAYQFPRRTDLASYRVSRERAKIAQRRARERDRARFRRLTKGRKQ